MSRRSKQRNYAQRASNREKNARSRDKRNRDIFNYEDTDTIPRFEGKRTDEKGGWSRFKEAQLSLLPQTLPRDPRKKCIKVYVEGYEDVSFWRGIFDTYESEKLTFEIGVPPREDLAKGKKVLLNMIPDSSPDCLLCVDSDFDFLFGKHSEQATLVTCSPYMFHTYAYATENFLCYAPSLHSICVRATKNDARIFDFEYFMAEYSKIIYPLFLWYAYSAHIKTENIFTLLEFKGSVKLNYLEVENNGRGTLEWLKRQVDKRLNILRRNYPDAENKVKAFEKLVTSRGITPQETYMFMQGHTLLDNVIIVMLNAVCEQLKLMSNIRITTSTKTGVALKNELSNYNNALRSVRDILLDNEGYKESELYQRLQADIERFLATL